MISIFLAKKNPQKMRVNNKLKEVILGTTFYTTRFYPKNVKQCNTIKYPITKNFA